MSHALSSADACRVLQPLFDLGDVRDLNGPAGRRLAELILPHTAGDLTVRAILELLEQVHEEAKAVTP